jgi:galactose mutarotase-like enzyme
MLNLSAGGTHLTVDPTDGGRIVALTVDDLSLLRTPQEDAGGTHWGCFVMAPWAGRTRHGRFSFDGVEHQLAIDSGEHAIHGTVRHLPWSVKEEDADGHRAVLRCDTGPGWPFAGWVEHELAVHEDRVELTLSVHAGREAMPAVAGWHPWWSRRLARGEEAGLHMPPARMFARDADGIPSGALVAPPPGPWDDCFTDLDGPSRLRWEGALELAVESDCPCLVVYTQPVEAICLEPQTGPPDALNHEPFVATPDRPLVAHSTWRWQQ